MDKNDYHCEDCEVCIQDYDHHCVFFSKCIGGGNIYAFWGTMILLIVNFMIFAMVMFLDFSFKMGGLKH